MPKNRPERNDGRDHAAQRRLRIQQIVFALLAIVLILSMLISLINF